MHQRNIVKHTQQNVTLESKETAAVPDNAESTTQKGVSKSTWSQFLALPSAESHTLGQHNLSIILAGYCWVQFLLVHINSRVKNLDIKNKQNLLHMFGRLRLCLYSLVFEQ